MGSAPLRTVGVLGGGITGLAASYYLRKRLGDSVKTILFEKSPRLGGWVKSISRTDGNDGVTYELGPRTIRPAGISGMNTLDLIEDLGLSEQVMFVKRDHPAAKTRFIYYKGELVKLPSDMKVLFKKQLPFDRPLIFAGFRDLFKWRKRLEDDSIHAFVARRFGKDIAEYVIDPMIRGICAGDSRQISVKFLMKTLFEFEQKYGSVALGFLLSRMFKGSKELDKSQEVVGFSNIALCSLRENWAVWTLEGGLETLPWRLQEYLDSQGENMEIVTNCSVKGIRLGCRNTPDDQIEVEYSVSNEDGSEEKNTLICDHLINTLPGAELGRVLKRSKPFHPSLSKVFETMESADVQVTNLMYKEGNLLKENAFGFLVPSSQKSGVAGAEGVLGVVFDSCSFPQGDKTILTVMSNPNTSGQLSTDCILNFIKSTLSIDAKPSDVNNEILRQCIPQYAVGHYEKVDAVRRYIKAAKFPLVLAGASYDGVSVNDCIYSGKKAADSIEI